MERNMSENKFSLTAALPDLVTVELPINGQVLQLDIDQNILTRDFLKEVDKMDGMMRGGEAALSEQFESMCFVLSTMIRKWNNTDSEPTAEYLGTLPMPIVAEMFRLVTDVFSPKKATSETSEDTTSAAAA
jgi:hypothetical protein